MHDGFSSNADSAAVSEFRIVSHNIASLAAMLQRGMQHLDQAIGQIDRITEAKTASQSLEAVFSLERELSRAEAITREYTEMVPEPNKLKRILEANDRPLDLIDVVNSGLSKAYELLNDVEFTREISAKAQQTIIRRLQRHKNRKKIGVEIATSVLQTAAPVRQPELTFEV